MAKVDVSEEIPSQVSEDSLVPWLMLPAEEGSDRRSFFSLSKGTMSRQINLPDAKGNKCYSSKGWLMKFYVIDVGGGITALDIKSDNTVEAKQVANLPNGLRLDEFRMKLYLVESAGKLLVVARNGVHFRDEVRSIGEEPIGEGHRRTRTYGANAFHVLEVDLSSNKWSQVKNLGNRSLFLGDNSSLSVEVLDISSLKPNCIYFTYDCQILYAVVEFFPEGGGRDMEIYNLKDGSIERIKPYFKGRSKCNFYDPITPPMWV
ncbi:hypothetical protein EZV62_022908 [Acer yangbiense]|uniref:KIB1-4 beta-propeller domain-containing protein n=1 Tax=Acer yangbiense TaxID=1000413 RepID=A0A5C7H023_9ROSI|nr:hypothetical protein EZV62_022908 [Acer yangbiense]